MNVRGHQIAGRLIDELVTAHPGQARKSVGDHQHREMAASVGGTSVACVTITFVDDLQALWLEQAQSSGEFLESCFVQGSTLMNGCTSNDSNTPSVTYGSAAIHSRAASTESNSATIRLPE